MPRRPRDSSAGVHHVWVNATGNWPYFVDTDDRLTWLRCLVRILDEYDWKCIAFAQVTTHVHLLVSCPDESLPEGMRELNREYSCYFNAVHGRVGAFVRKRFGSRRVTDGHDLLGAYAYVVLNPFKEGLCRHPEDWPWGGYRTSIGLSSEFPFVDASTVLAEIDGSRDALRRYVETAAAKYRRPLGPRPGPGSGRGVQGHVPPSRPRAARGA